MSRARTAANDEAEIRQLLDRWGKAFRAKDINAVSHEHNSVPFNVETGKASLDLKP